MKMNKSWLKDLYLRLTHYFYLGSKYKCPFCSKSFRKFRPGGTDQKVLRDKKIIGGGSRQNAKCPFCNSRDRERLLYLFIKTKTELLSSNKLIKLLHVAPEKNLQKVFQKQKNIKYASADLKSPRAEIKMDITNIKFNDDFFDVIICNHVLEHIIDDKKAISEIYRVLKPGGWAILQVPISTSIDKTFEDPDAKTPKQRKKIFGQKDHVRIYGQDYKDHLKSVGFEVRVDDFSKTLDKDTLNKYSLNEEEKIYFCTKK